MQNITKQKQIIQTYLRAKDENKPHLMKELFTDSAILEMKLKTENISFPSKTVGLDNITEVLIKNFSNSYENIYTLCFEDTIVSDTNSLFCSWLVGMSEKNTDKVRVGSGIYTWQFNANNTKVEKLTIVINEMVILESNVIEKIMFWLNNCSYCWCELENTMQTMPKLKKLEIIRNALK